MVAPWNGEQFHSDLLCIFHCKASFIGLHSRLLCDFGEFKIGPSARWVGDTEEVMLRTYSHLVPNEKDQIGRLLDGE